jgi:hypothetical protein
MPAEHDPHWYTNATQRRLGQRHPQVPQYLNAVACYPLRFGVGHASEVVFLWLHTRTPPSSGLRPPLHLGCPELLHVVDTLVVRESCT